MSAPRTLLIDQLRIQVYSSNVLMGQAAAQEAKAILLRAIAERGQANAILATGNSQLSTLRALRSQPGVDWAKVRFFHMDEYIGIPPAHPARFANFLQQHFFDHLASQSLTFHPVPLLSDAADVPAVQAACDAYKTLLEHHPADLCLLGIGENGHIAFNDPPYAQFDDPLWVKPVQLAPQSRQQQVGEGHFASLDETPTHALTLTIPALLRAKRLLAIVPEERKAWAVRLALYGPISQELPASILRLQAHATLYLDQDSAGLI